MSNYISVYDDVLKPNQCQHLIDKFEDSKHQWQKTELKGHNERMEALSSGVTRLVKGTVQKEIHSEVSRILTKAIKQ